jgi:glucarate dehydratase
MYWHMRKTGAHRMTRRRDFLLAGGLGSFTALTGLESGPSPALAADANSRDLTITGLTVTPIALPDPPILAASGCHGPYFLRNIVEVYTADGIVGIGETYGGAERTVDLEKCRDVIFGKSAFAYRAFQKEIQDLSMGAWAGIEVACLDAVGKAAGLSISQLLGGPIRDEVEFGGYLFFRYAADDPRILEDSRIVDDRGRGDAALDQWGEVRTPEAMAEMAWQWHEKWGFTNQKLKAGVLPPDVELAALRAINERFHGTAPLRIDPNGRWTMETAVRIGEEMRDLPIEYYEDPVRGQDGMAEVRRKTGHVMSTNSCVTAFDHIPEAIEKQPIDVVLCDHHYWGGIPACQALGRMAETLEWTLSQHSNSHAGVSMAAMIHVAAVVPQLTHPSDTHYPWLIEGADVIEGPKLPIAGGKMKVPTAPGVGVSLDQDKLARAHETYVKCGMRGRDDATTMQMVEPGWTRTLF